ncbi:MAG: hypothetical protein HY532_05760 [Chloroflexi bacterium]|nr:hypothetical protein [Chloroflexota bacterium]
MYTTAVDHSVRVVSARWAGWGLLVSFVSLLIIHGGAQAVAGQRVSGTSDVAAIAAYYSYHGLLPLYWQHGVMVLTFFAFVVAFRRYLMDMARTTLDRVLVDLGALIAAAVIPLGLAVLGLQMAMVQVVDTPSQDGLLGLFAAWDWIYNSTFYWLEVGWMAAFNLAALRLAALPRWIAVLGLIVPLFHAFHTSVLMLGLSDQLTLPGTALFMVWFVATGVYLVKRS